jgi:chemotaxis protein CheD
VRHHIGIGEMRVSADEGEVFAVKSLASCVAVAVYDAHSKTGGLLRCVLPSSEVDSERAADSPQTFADTGVVGIIDALEELGSVRDQLVAILVGGSNLLGEHEVFNLGDRVSQGIRLALQSHGVAVKSEDLGGVISRDLEFRLSDGRVVVTSSGAEKVLN